MRTYELYLDLGDNGECMAHAPVLLGANVTARNKERALSKMRKEIPAYIEWLRGFGEGLEVPGDDFDIDVVEVMRGTDPWNAGGVNALFGPDKVPPTSRQIDTYLRWMGHSREHLLNVVKDLPQEILTKEHGNEPRTIQNTLEHIADTEWWYLTRMGPDPEISPDDFPEVFNRLRRVRGYAVGRLGAIPKGDLGKVGVPTRYASPQQRRLKEAWTWHKVFRRFLEHERQHTRYIERLLRTYHGD